MKILHFSDNHSQFFEFPKSGYDIIVCSGDFFPDGPQRGHVNNSKKFQEQWLIANDEKIKKWINKPFIWCSGNHDYISPVPLMNKMGIEAYDITNVKFSFNGFNFYGFPYIPYTGANWNFEQTPRLMDGVVDNLINIINNDEIDILVAHCPPYGYCDKESINSFGNNNLTIGLKTKAKTLPKLMLCGHVHGGDSKDNFKIHDAEMNIFNSARRVQIIPINK